MNKDTEDLLKDNRETLETIANADCSASWIADRLLDSLEGDSSPSTSEPIEPSTEADISPQNPPEEQHKDPPEPEGSIFAY